jgi:hypothetical protein
MALMTSKTAPLGWRESRLLDAKDLPSCMMRTAPLGYRRPRLLDTENCASWMQRTAPVGCRGPRLLDTETAPIGCRRPCLLDAEDLASWSAGVCVTCVALNVKLKVFSKSKQHTNSQGFRPKVGSNQRWFKNLTRYKLRLPRGIIAKF